MDFTKSEQTTGAMNRTNVLPYDGLAYLVDDTGGKFEWPVCQRAEAIRTMRFCSTSIEMAACRLAYRQRGGSRGLPDHSQLVA